MIRRQALIWAAISSLASAVWVGEDYWTTVFKDGHLETDREVDDFLHFKVFRDEVIDAFIAFIIQKDGSHFESFGHGFIDPSTNQVCGRFLAREGGSQTVCGGFRILSINKYTEKSPFFFVNSRVATAYDSVGYRRKQIARIWLDNQHTGQIFGGVDLAAREAYGIHLNGTVIKISYNSDPQAYHDRVQVLHVERNEPTVRWPDTVGRKRRVHHVHRRHHGRPNQHSRASRERMAKEIREGVPRVGKALN